MTLWVLKVRGNAVPLLHSLVVLLHTRMFQKALVNVFFQAVSIVAQPSSAEIELKVPGKR